MVLFTMNILYKNKIKQVFLAEQWRKRFGQHRTPYARSLLLPWASVEIFPGRETSASCLSFSSCRWYSV